MLGQINLLCNTNLWGRWTVQNFIGGTPLTYFRFLMHFYEEMFTGRVLLRIPLFDELFTKGI
jgi:hypothetical protein